MIAFGCAISLVAQAAPALAQPSSTELVQTPPIRVQPWTLEELESIAETNSPNLRSAAAEVEAQRGRALQAGLYPNPVLQGGSNQLNGDASQYFAMLSQEIVTKHKLRLDEAAARSAVTQAELRFVRIRFELLTNVRRGFYAALVAQARRGAADRLLGIARKSTEVARSLEKSQLGARGDTLLLEIEFDRAGFNVENAAASLDAALRQLAAIAGDPTIQIERVQGNLSEVLPDYPYELVRSGLVSRNASVASARVEVDRQRLLLQRANVEPFPNVTVQSGAMFQPVPPYEMGIIQFSIPVPLWNKNQGNIQAARAGVRMAAQDVRKVENDLSKQLAEATGRFEVASQQVAKYERSILPKARQSAEITNKAFELGEFDLMRVLQSQRAVIESELNYLIAQENRWAAAAEIAGLLQEEQFPPAPEPARR